MWGLGGVGVDHKRERERKAKVVINAAKVDQLFLDIVNDVTGSRVPIARLPHRADVDEVLQVLLDLNQLRSFLPNLGASYKDAGDMGMTMETDVCKLIRKVRHGVELVGHVAPDLRLVQSRVDDGEV